MKFTVSAWQCREESRLLLRCNLVVGQSSLQTNAINSSDLQIAILTLLYQTETIVK